MTAKIIQFPGSGVGRQILELKNKQQRLAEAYRYAVGDDLKEIQARLRVIGNELFHLAMSLTDTKKFVMPPPNHTSYNSKGVTITLNDKFKYMVRPEPEPEGKV